MSRSGQPSDDAGGRRSARDDLPSRPPGHEDEAGRSPAAPIVEVHGTDVQPGPDVTDQPRAGATEPPD